MTDAKLPGFQECFAESEGVRLRYFAAGEGEPLLLLHGLGGAASNWVETAPLLAARRRVVVPDLPGHGGSEPLADVPDLDVLADLIGELGDREGLWPGPVVGHSLGGTLGLRLAVRRPGDVTGLVLAAAAGISSCTPGAARAMTCVSLVRPARFVVPFRGVIARRPLLRYVAFAWWGASDPPALSERATAGLLAAAAEQTDPWPTGRALVRHDPRLDLERVACPCLVLWGARDHWVPLRDGFEYARRLGAPLRAIAGCGHLLIAERPDVCVGAILEFLEPLQNDASPTGRDGRARG